jgi:uncharacterized protein (TIGR02246 family)
MSEPAEAVPAATALYRRLIEGWNASDANAMGAVLAENSLVIGFDGSQMSGRDQVVTELSRIFTDHQVARYVTKVRSVTPLGGDAAVLHAVVGMVPPGGSEIVPEQNAIQTVVAHRAGSAWSVALFQTTPARFHGRPELSDALTAELSEVLRLPHQDG